MGMYECKRNRFVIHKHIGVKSKLHYDIRITYKPSKDSKCRLLSFATKKLTDLIYMKVSKIQLFPTVDHDISYINFEGTNEEGKTTIYDKGYFKVIKFNRKKLIIYFFGQKIKGCYFIVRIDDSNTQDFYSKKTSWIMGKCKNY